MIRSSLLTTLPGVSHVFLDAQAPCTPAGWVQEVGGAPDEVVVQLRQVHGARTWGWCPGLAWEPWPEGDAVVSRHGGTVLAVRTADCVPILLAVPGAVAAVHAGWRGTAADVVGAALSMLTAEPLRGPVRAAVGPAIGACCYEVGPEVVRALAAKIPSDVFLVAGYPRPHVDLQRANAWLLGQRGVEVEVIPACTACSRRVDGQPRFHSYRRDGPGAGRQYTCIRLDS